MCGHKRKKKHRKKVGHQENRRSQKNKRSNCNIRRNRPKIGRDQEKGQPPKEGGTINILK